MSIHISKQSNHNPQLETPTKIPSIPVVFYEVSADILHLLGLDILDAENLLSDTVINWINFRKIIACEGSSPRYEIYDWYMQMKGICTNLFVNICRPTIQVNFTRHKVSKKHGTFFHPCVGKVLKIIRRSRSDEAQKETRRILEDINCFWDPFQRIQTGPWWFGVSFGTINNVLNERILLHLT